MIYALARRNSSASSSNDPVTICKQANGECQVGVPLRNCGPSPDLWVGALEHFRFKWLHFLLISAMRFRMKSSAPSARPQPMLEKFDRSVSLNSPTYIKPSCLFSGKSRRDDTKRSPQRKLWGRRERQRQAPAGRHTDFALVPPRQGSASSHASSQLPLWATFGVVPSGLSRKERR